MPQGSVLESILFLIYVNDLPLSLTSTCADILTDDTTVGTSSHSIDTLVETLTTDLLYLFGATISNTAGITLLNIVILIYYYWQE